METSDAAHRAVTRENRRPRYGGNVRISADSTVEDPETGEARPSEKGITRQKEDVLALAERLGVEIGEWYVENDTSAFKKKRIRLPDGRSVWRVIRPEFRRMLADYEDGRIDGIIFYDLDRLTRQNRDLEDLIDLVEFFKRPVESVTGQLDLRTSNGRAMARVLVAMANKSSEDTARRVARAKLQSAQQGKGRRFNAGRRPFGWRTDGSVDPVEAELIRAGARRFMAGESWMAVARYFTDSGVSPVMARRWVVTTVKQILLSPSIAGIAVYNGALRKENQEGQRRNAYLDPEGVALRDASGSYVRGNWEPILTVEQWEGIIAEHKHRRSGKTFTSLGTKKYLLSGLLRCGKTRDDGTVCNRGMVGAVRKYETGTTTTVYKCPHKGTGGCGGIQRDGAKLDQLVEDLLFAHIAENAPTAADLETNPGMPDPEAEELTDVQRRLRNLREKYATGQVSDDTFFATVPVLEAREKELKAAQKKRATARIGMAMMARSPDQVREEWDAATTAGKRAILGQYLQAIVIRPSATRGPKSFDYSAIQPMWKPVG